MKKILLLCFLAGFILSLQMGCLGQSVSEEEVIHVSIRSEPSGAKVYTRIVSTVAEVKSTNRFYLGSTPYQGTQSLGIPGLTLENASKVSLVFSVEKGGYHLKEERYNILSLLNTLEISTKFQLIPMK